jgi:hypothetical protein
LVPLRERDDFRIAARGNSCPTSGDRRSGFNARVSLDKFFEIGSAVENPAANLNVSQIASRPRKPQGSSANP